MFARSQQISAPLLLPMLGSILTTGIIASLLLSPPSRPSSLSLHQLLLRAAFDLLIAACVHAATVWSIWRLIRDYLEPSAGVLTLHLWAVVVWLPLIATLNAERSVWASCLVPWACANAITFLNLWARLPSEPDPEPPVAYAFLQPPSAPPLWKSLLPYGITAFVLQAGLACLAAAHIWSAAALFSSGVLLFLIRHPFLRGTARNRRKFSRAALLQTAAVFFLISTALSPFLQKAYGFQSFAALLAVRPAPVNPLPKLVTTSGFSGVILTVPAKPHPRVKPPTPSTHNTLSTALAKPVIIPFDGAYWYFKQPDTRPRRTARIQQGDPLKANIYSTDHRELQMEAHQDLATPLSADCCHAIRLDLLNGDTRAGLIRVALRLDDTSTKPGASLLLGSIPLPSSQLQHIPLNRPPVAEFLRFQLPPAARGRHYNEITVIISPTSDRALAGANIAIQNFVLLP